MLSQVPLRPLARFLVRSLCKHSSTTQSHFRSYGNTRDCGTRTTTVHLPDTKMADSVHVELGTRGGGTVKTSFHHFWLRDSCQCPQCHSAVTNQRLLDTSSLSIGIRPKELSVLDRTSLMIRWEDEHCSSFSGDWLLKHLLHTAREEPVERVVWGCEVGENPPTLCYHDVMTRDMGVLNLYKNMQVYGFCLVRDTPLELSANEGLIRHIGMIRHTFFGGLCVIEANQEKKDTAYSDLAIDPHTDGNYFNNPPGMLVFHTLKFEGPKPCLNSLVDGEKLRQTIRAEHPRHYQILCNVPLSYHHWDKDHRYLNSFVPFKVDPDTDKLCELHFNNHDRLPLSKASLDALLKIHPDGTLLDVYEAIQTVIRTSKQEDIQYKIHLEPGNLLIIDNHRLMHARSEFKGHRVLVATYMDKEDLLSTVLSITGKT